MWPKQLRIAITLGGLTVVFCGAAEAKNSEAHNVRLTHEVRSKLIDIADSLEQGSVKTFTNSAISDDNLIMFSFTYAMMHSRQKANGWFHLPSEQLKKISFQFFGKRFEDKSLESTVKYKNGYYDGNSFDPTSSPGGYKVVSLMQVSPHLFQACLNSYGVPDGPYPAPYVQIRLLLRDVVVSNKHHFVVVSYSGEENQPTIHPYK